MVLPRRENGLGRWRDRPGRMQNKAQRELKRKLKKEDLTTARNQLV